MVSVLSGCNAPKNVSKFSSPTSSTSGKSYDVKLVISDAPSLTGIKQNIDLDVSYSNDTEHRIRFTINTYRVAEVDITFDAKDRSPLYGSINNYVNQLRKNRQRMYPGYYPCYDSDYNTFDVNAGGVHRGKVTFHADQVGIFQLQAIADLKFADGTVQHLASNKIEIAVLPLQEFPLQK